MDNDKSKIDNDVLKYYNFQADATKVVMRMLFFLNYGGIVATLAALGSSSFGSNKGCLSICLLIFILGLIFAISMVMGLRQFAFRIYSRSDTIRNEKYKSCPNYNNFKNEIENEMRNSSWRSLIFGCAVTSLILFLIGIVIGFKGMFI